MAGYIWWPASPSCWDSRPYGICTRQASEQRGRGISTGHRRTGGLHCTRRAPLQQVGLGWRSLRSLLRPSVGSPVAALGRVGLYFARARPRRRRHGGVALRLCRPTPPVRPVGCAARPRSQKRGRAARKGDWRISASMLIMVHRKFSVRLSARLLGRTLVRETTNQVGERTASLARLYEQKRQLP